MRAVAVRPPPGWNSRGSPPRPHSLRSDPAEKPVRPPAKPSLTHSAVQNQPASSVQTNHSRQRISAAAKVVQTPRLSRPTTPANKSHVQRRLSKLLGRPDRPDPAEKPVRPPAKPSLTHSGPYPSGHPLIPKLPGKTCAANREAPGPSTRSGFVPRCVPLATVAWSISIHARDSLSAPTKNSTSNP
jgi:hypothetical protein